MIHIPEIKDSSVFRKINNHAVLILDFRNQMIRVDIEEGSGQAEYRVKDDCFSRFAVIE